MISTLKGFRVIKDGITINEIRLVKNDFRRELHNLHECFMIGIDCDKEYKSTLETNKAIANMIGATIEEF